MPADWPKLHQELLERLDPGNYGKYRSADAAMVGRALAGLGPDSATRRPDAGARVVYNISAAHLPAVLNGGRASRYNRPYKNRYDLPTRIGEPVAESGTRSLVDGVVAGLLGQSGGQNLYYGAIELNGSGMRYYGDMCMVLRPEATEDETLVLHRNSYELARRPMRDEIMSHAGDHERRETAARLADAMAGRWPTDIADMAVCKVLDGAAPSSRLLTSGMISDGVLCDEDYMEVVRTASFGAEELEEIRLSSAEVSVDSRIADRLFRGPAPSATELLWRRCRRVAERAAARTGIPTRVIVTSGRMRV